MYELWKELHWLNSKFTDTFERRFSIQLETVNETFSLSSSRVNYKGSGLTYKYKFMFEVYFSVSNEKGLW